MKTYNNLYRSIISPENLFLAWDAFKSDKRDKIDVQKFEWNLEENIFKLHSDLKRKIYEHGPYEGFYICDPKPRHIHKASVRDRILHHAIFSILNPIFEPTFISNSFSCRIGRGTHKGVIVLEKMTGAVSGNGTKQCFILKCDIRKFFNNVNHEILILILKRKINDSDTISLLEKIIRSFNSGESDLFNREGLPIGNLTSQLFANVYMNEFDQFAKHKLKVKNYCRYTDDFVIVSKDDDYLANLIPQMKNFLDQRLKLELHPSKISIRKFKQGIDFLGYVIFPHYRLLRNKTKQRMFKKLRRKIMEYKTNKISEQSLEQSLQSYLGVLSHANSFNLSQELRNQYWFGLTN